MEGELWCIQRLTITQKEILLSIFFFRKQEKDTTFSMHPNKEPGQDIFNPKFYLVFWSILGGDIIDACLTSWLGDEFVLIGLNRTTIVLILKKDNLYEMDEFLLIYLC